MVPETRRPDRWIGRGVAGIRELRVLVSEREFYTDAEGWRAGGDAVGDDDGGVGKVARDDAGGRGRRHLGNLHRGVRRGEIQRDRSDDDADERLRGSDQDGVLSVRAGEFKL